MAKTKTPLLSLAAKGTLGRVLTFQKRGRDTIARTKPIPKDPYSLNQAYQRWLYKDYAYLWTLLSNSEKQVYRTKASRYHITGFSQWMREHLKKQTDILGWWKMDDNLGATTIDSSPYGHDATIIGATPTTLAIDGALEFDGINNYLLIPHAPHLSLAYPWSIQFFINLTAIADQELFSKVLLAGPWTGVNIKQQNLKLLARLYNVNGGFVTLDDPVPLNDGLTHLITLQYDGADATLYKDNALLETQPLTKSVGNDQPLRLGFDTPGWIGTWFDGKQDNLIIRNRLLTLPEITRQSLRRYPA